MCLVTKIEICATKKAETTEQLIVSNRQERMYKKEREGEKRNKSRIITRESEIVEEFRRA